MSVRDDKRAHMRGVSALAIAAAAAMLVAAAACMLLIADQSRLAIGQQANESGPMASSSSSRARSDPTAVSPKQTEVPDIGVLMGLTYEQAVVSIGHGATVVDDRAVSEAGTSAGRIVTIALASERSDPQTGAPTVYLGLDASGRVCSAAYSVSMESLGYSNELTFRQALQRVHVVERTLEDAGVEVGEGAVSVPADREGYSTYLSDGRTLQREYATFGGEVEVGGASLGWSASLDYNYSDAIGSGNLADAMHLITVGIAAR